MAVVIHPGKIKGKVVVPSSKSLSHRALLAALLSDEDTKIYNLSICDDVVATMNIMEYLGKKVIDKKDYHLVTKCEFKEGVLNANESGSTLRFIIPILSAVTQWINTKLMPQQAPSNDPQANSMASSTYCFLVALSFM